MSVTLDGVDLSVINHEGIDYTDVFADMVQVLSSFNGVWGGNSLVRNNYNDGYTGLQTSGNLCRDYHSLLNIQGAWIESLSDNTFLGSESFFVYERNDGTTSRGTGFLVSGNTFRGHNDTTGSAPTTVNFEGNSGWFGSSIIPVNQYDKIVGKFVTSGGLIKWCDTGGDGSTTYYCGGWISLA